MENLEQHDQTEALFSAFQNFHRMTAEQREEIRKAWVRKDRTVLVQKYGLDSDNSNMDSNSRVSPR